MRRFRPAALAPALAVLLAAVAALASAPPAKAGTAYDKLGVYRGCCSPAPVAAWETWLRRPAYRVLDFLADENWSKIENPQWWIDKWKPSPYRGRMVWSVPMLVADRGDGTPATLAECATGAYAPHFSALAKKLGDNGFGGSVIRLGWEMNGDWYRWGLGRPGNTAADYVACWRSVVWAMRRPGTWFTFDWNANARTAPDPEPAYPGNDVVDVIGLDAYDTDAWTGLRDGWRGLAWHRAFAASKGKRVSFPEWGLWPSRGDDPGYVDAMTGWIDQAGTVSTVSYHDFWEGGFCGSCGTRFMLGFNPLAAARFQALYAAPA